jgi:hypothetical protein
MARLSRLWSTSRTMKKVVIASDAGEHAIHACVSGSDVTGIPKERDAWVKGAVEDRGVYHDLDEPYAMQPLELRVPSHP